MVQGRRSGRASGVEALLSLSFSSSPFASPSLFLVVFIFFVFFSFFLPLFLLILGVFFIFFVFLSFSLPLFLFILAGLRFLRLFAPYLPLIPILLTVLLSSFYNSSLYYYFCFISFNSSYSISFLYFLIRLLLFLLLLLPFCFLLFLFSFLFLSFPFLSSPLL